MRSGRATDTSRQRLSAMRISRFARSLGSGSGGFSQRSERMASSLAEFEKALKEVYTGMHTDLNRQIWGSGVSAVVERPELPKRPCGECMQDKEIHDDDYLCAHCRRLAA